MPFKHFTNRIIFCICIFQLIFIGGMSLSAFAGTFITVDEVRTQNVYGNSIDLNHSVIEKELLSGNHILVGTGADMNSTNSIYGAFIDHGYIPLNSEMHHNRIDVNGGSNLRSMVGGYLRGAYQYNVHHNTVNISNGLFNSDTPYYYGGFADSMLDTLVSTIHDVKYNTVNIDNGTFTNNTLTIHGGHSASDDAYAAFDTAQNVIGNVVNIRSGTFSNSLNAYTATIYGGYAYSTTTGSSGNVKNNEVNISGGSFNSTADTHSMEIYGGYSEYLNQDTKILADVSDNIVNITGGTFGGKNLIICGGVVNNGVAKNNTVTIGSAAVFTADNITLCGGLDYTDPDGSLYNRDVRTGNKLNMQGSIAITELKNFDRYDFYVPADMPDGGTMITLNSSVPMTGSASTVRVGLQPGNSNLLPGYKIILVDDTGLSGGIAKMFKNYNGTGYSNDFRERYVFDTILDDFQFIISYKGTESSPQLKSLAHGMLSGVSMINQGADIVQDHLASYSDLSYSSAYGVKFFNNSKHGSSTHHIDSYRGVPISQNNKIESDSLTQITGGSYSKYGGRGLTNIGAFYESGASSYKSRDVYDELTAVNGSGNVSYKGGGVFGRQEFGSAGNSRIYVEAAGRVGQMDVDLATDWQDPSNDQYIGYSLSPNYYSVQGGVGYIWKEKSGKGNKGVDLSTKYLQTTVQGESARLSNGYDVTFDDVNSRRIKTGARFSYLPTKQIDTYIGAAYEYELDGEVKTKVDGDNTNVSPDVKGGTAIGEVGVVLGRLPVTLDLSLKGSAGRREDFSVDTELIYDF